MTIQPTTHSSVRVHFLLVGFIAVTTVPWLFTGYALPDIGWHLTKQFVIVRHPASGFWEASWLCSVLGGLWMDVVSPTLLSLRFASLACYIGIALLLYRILTVRFDPTAVGIAIVPVHLLLLSGTVHFVPNYYIVPPLFGLAFVLFYMRSFQVERTGYRVLYGLGAGLMLAALVMARLPSLLAIVVPFAGLAVEFHDKAVRRSSWNRVGTVLGGFGLGCLVAFLVLEAFSVYSHVVGDLQRLMTGTVTDTGESNIHEPSRLVVDTAIRYVKVGAVGLAVLGLARVWRRVADRLDRRWQTAGFLLAVVGTIAFTAFMEMNRFGSFPLPLGISLVLFVWIAPRVWRSGTTLERILLVVAFLYMVTMNAGSSNNMSFSLKFTVLLVLPIGLMYVRTLTDRDSPLRFMRTLLYVNLGTLFLVSRLALGWGTILKWDTRVDAQPLASTCETGEYAVPLNRLLHDMRAEGIQDGDTILCYPDIPIVYFATRTIPFLENPWISDFAVGYPSSEDIALEFDTRSTLPQYIVRDLAPDVEGGKSATIDSIVASLRYDTVAVADNKYLLLRRP